MGKLSELLDKVNDTAFGINRKFGSAVIVAGGSGQRAGTTGKTKQMMPLLGVPVIVRTISAFEKCRAIDEIIIVAKKEEIPIYGRFIKKYGFKKISDSSELVYIHDGARCLITPENIEKVGRQALLRGVSFAAKRPTDTVRYEDGDKGLSTVDRNRVWLAETPQVFKTEIYRASAYYGLKNEIKATDDIMLAEAAGFSSVPVDIGGGNMKITLPQDFAVAEAILRFEGREGL